MTMAVIILMTDLAFMAVFMIVLGSCAEPE